MPEDLGHNTTGANPDGLDTVLAAVRLQLPPPAQLADALVACCFRSALWAVHTSSRMKIKNFTGDQMARASGTRSDEGKRDKAHER
jgi:hypothetical protein